MLGAESAPAPVFHDWVKCYPNISKCSISSMSETDSGRSSSYWIILHQHPPKSAGARPSQIFKQIGIAGPLPGFVGGCQPQTAKVVDLNRLLHPLSGAGSRLENWWQKRNRLFTLHNSSMQQKLDIHIYIYIGYIDIHIDRYRFEHVLFVFSSI